MSLYLNAPSSRATGAAILCSLLLLAGCKQKQAADQPANVVEPVKLPPAITKSQSFRCKDNSLVYIDFFADNLSLNLRTGENGAIHHLVAATPGGPFFRGRLHSVRQQSASRGNCPRPETAIMQILTWRSRGPRAARESLHKSAAGI